VAAWQIQKRGVECDFVFCNLGGPAHLREVLRVAVHLASRWSYGTRPRLHAIDFEPIAAALRAHTQARYWQILLKRQMLRAAEAVAEQIGASAIVTGDSVGQVSSQTLPNLAVVSRATPLAVLRPLVGFDKSEIVDLARAIGTYELSESVGEYCALVPSKPATQARLDAVLAEEARFLCDPLEGPLAERTAFALRELDEAAFDDGDLAIEELPAGAILVDVRPARAVSRRASPGRAPPRLRERARGVAELRSRPALRALVRVRTALGAARRPHAARGVSRPTTSAAASAR
jgi:thiamine biosynthesis protein ThiI